MIEPTTRQLNNASGGIDFTATQRLENSMGIKSIVQGQSGAGSHLCRLGHGTLSVATAGVEATAEISDELGERMIYE